MGWWQRFADRLAPTERRAVDPSWGALQTYGMGGTGPVTPRVVENLSTVLACVSAISTAIASLPANVFRPIDAGREIDEHHPVQMLIARGPNEHQTWPDYCEWLVAQCLLRGNALSELVYDPSGRLQTIVPIPWDWVSVQLLPSGRLAYDVIEQIGLHGATGRVRRLLGGEVLHLRDRSDDGLVGRSRLLRAAGAAEAAVLVQTHSNKIFANAARPSGVLETDHSLGPEAIENLKRSFQEGFQGAANAGKTLVLEGGLKWKPLTWTPEDTELLAVRRFTTEELARIFGCPPPIIGDLSHGTFTNSETAGRWFAQHTLTPWVRKIETEFCRPFSLRMSA